MIKKNGGIFGRNPTYNDVVVEGVLTLKEAQVFDNDITINGDLTVNGTETVINTVELNVDDKNITMGAVVAKVGLAATTNITAGQFTVQLADTSGLIPGMTVTKTAGTGAFGASPKIASVDSHTQITLTVAHATSGTIIFDTGGATDDTADGGGITLKGTTDKFIKWVKANLAWVFSDPIKAPDVTVDNLTASKPVFTDANKKLTSSGTLAIDQGGTGSTTAADARTALGLGTMATQAANNVAITGGAVDGVSIGGTTAATIANVDNLRLDGNTLSSTNANGDINLSANGTGQTKVNGGSNDRVLALSTTAATGYSSAGLNKGSLQLVSGNATNAVNGIEFAAGGSNQMFFGTVQEAGGAATMVIQGYNGTNYRGRFSWISTGQWTSTSQLTGTYSATAANAANASAIIYGQGGTGCLNGIEFSSGGSNENYVGYVQEAGGAGAFVIQGYNGTAYAERLRAASSGDVTVSTGNLVINTVGKSLKSATGSDGVVVEAITNRAADFNVAAGATVTVTISGVIYGSLMVSFGAYASAAQGWMHRVLSIGGYQASSLYDVTTLASASHANTVLGAVTKNASSVTFTIANNGSTTLQGNWRFQYSGQAGTITITVA